MDPKHNSLFAKSPNSWHACSFFACFCAFLAWFAPEMVHSCVSNMLSPSEIVFAAVLGFFCSLTPLWDGLSLLMKQLQARMPRHTSLPCCCYVFACSFSSFDCPCLLRSRFPSMDLASIDGLSLRRWEWRSRFTPFTTLSESIWCSNHDSTNDIYVLPRISSTAHHLSPPAVIMHLQSAVCFADPAIFGNKIPLHYTFFLSYFIISCSISVCWLWASSLKNPMQTPWQQQDFLFLTFPRPSFPRKQP